MRGDGPRHRARYDAAVMIPGLPRPTTLTLVGLLLACGKGPATETPRPQAAIQEEGASAPPRPDVLLVVLDTVRADRTSALHPDPAVTPVLRRLSRSGLTFTTAVAPAPWTLPSMAALFTGDALGANRNQAINSRPSLAERLREGGYLTSAVVGNYLLHGGNGFDRGFDDFAVPDAASNGEPPWDAAGLVEQALRRAAEQPPDHPWFLWVHLMDPHAPYRADRAPLVPSEEGWTQGPGGARITSVPWSRSPLSPHAASCLSEQRRAYDGEIAATDTQLGALFEGLRRLRPRARLVAVVADHGEGLWNHARPDGWNADQPTNPEDPDSGRWLQCVGALSGGYDEHGDQFFEEALRVPLVLSGPGVPHGAQDTRMVDTRLLGDTMLQLVGLTAPGPTLPLAANQSAPGEVVSVGPRGWSLRTPTWKFVRVLPRFSVLGQTEFLFGLGSGPWAPEDLDRTAEEPEVRDALRARLDAWMEAHPTPPDPGPDLETQARLRALGYTDPGSPALPSP